MTNKETTLKTHHPDNRLSAHYSQRGIADFPDHAIFASFFIKTPEKCYKKWLALAKLTDRLCADTHYQTVCVRGVDYQLWESWCKKNKMPIPAGLTSTKPLKAAPFAHTGGHFWFHIKGASEQACQKILEAIIDALKNETKKYLHTIAAKRHDGKVFGGRFTDAMINPVDPVNLSERIIVGGEDKFYLGSSYVIQQKFKHNWVQLDNMNGIEKQNMIGRNFDDTIIPMADERSHIKCVRQLNGERVTLRILRQALPFGESDSGKGNEEGIYFVAYADNSDVYHGLIEGIRGDKKGFIKDKMLNNTHAESGNFWFIPSSKLAGLKNIEEDIHVPLNDFFNVRSANGLMYYNNRDFLHQIRKKANKLHISDRITRLIAQTFSNWNDTWEKKVTMPAIGHLQDYVKTKRWKEYKSAATASVALRKGLAIKISLSDVLLQERFRGTAGLYNIKPGEIIVGNMPPLTLGSGSRVMEYLNEEEKIESFFGMLNEYSATGHNVPNYYKPLKLGIGGMIDEASHKLAHAEGEQKDFYQSVVWSLEGVSDFIHAYAKLADELAAEDNISSRDRDNYKDIATRMNKLAKAKPDSMLEALQLIFLINCALHQTGEPMSIGRLDQYLISFYHADIKAKRIKKAEAQEIIDAFWLKMDETVLYNRQHMEDYLTYGTGAVFYSAGNFPQGSALNQWVQQVTVGGYLPNNDKKPTDGCNDVTLLCLRAARRLPLNAPCLSLRVNKRMKGALQEKILGEAARALLSGGAHPVLLNDDKLVEGLHRSGPLSLQDARDYTSDGCYEPIINGKSEWVFSYVPILPAVGMAMNQGATIEGAGWVHLRGLKSSWNSPPPQEIHSFEQFLEIFFTHYKWLISSFFNSLVNNYGALWKVCPSPLFSSMVDGCMESGRDMTNGGAEYHIVAPMMCGITNAINSLYAIKKLVYDPATASTTLEELLQALWNNWGETMQEPFHNTLAGPGRAADVASRYKELRIQALALPKFGEGTCEEVKTLADDVVTRCVDIIQDGLGKPLPGINNAYEALKEKYHIDGRPFAFTVTPGVGTFEDNIGLGLGMGASADGRLASETIADDFSATPSPEDQPPKTEPQDIYQSLKDWNMDSIGIGISNAAPVDLNIHENFKEQDLEKVIKAFANGKIGSNLLTITTADPETYEQAVIYPEKYDLVRVRQGGWSEFYMAMFPAHQNYILRRPYYAVKKK